jgi:undecaprenol kinase
MSQCVPAGAFQGTPARHLRLYVLDVTGPLSALVGLSRIYLGVHWPSDVLAGWAAGAAWAPGFLVAGAAHPSGRKSGPMKGQPFLRRLGFALQGLRTALGRETSFRTQLAFGVAVLVALAVIRPAAIWWAVCALAIGLVLVAELMNSALEALADRLHPEQHPEIRIAKDLAAAAVLVAAGTAVAVAVILVLR